LATLTCPPQEAAEGVGPADLPIFPSQQKHRERFQKKISSPKGHPPSHSGIISVGPGKACPLLLINADHIQEMEAFVMTQLRPDQTFYPSPKMAMKAEPEKLAYVAMLNPGINGSKDALAVVDVDPKSKDYARVIYQLDMPHPGDELHHFGWNACSSCLCPHSPHPHMERRYLIVPGLRSSRIHIIDTKPDPRKPHMSKVLEPEEVMKKTGYSRVHTSHCGPDGIYMNALGSPDGGGPGGIFTLDPETFQIKGRWDHDRGDQYLMYDFWWHLGNDTLLTSEWGTPQMVEDGANPELLLAGKYGHAIHVWDMAKRRHLQTLDLGAEQQMVLELRPAHDPRESYGFACVVVSLKDLSSSVWLWYRDGGNGDGPWKTKKVIEIPAEPADPEVLPPMLKGFKAVSPFITDIDLSLDDRFLYVSCWATGELKQYDVSDPFNPRETASVRIGGIVRRQAHPSKPDVPLNGGPQMVEISRDGKRVYLTNSLYRTWDEQFYPDGIRGWMVKLDVGENGGMKLDPRFFLEGNGLRPHQVRLQGGDSSSDSYCYSSEDSR
jgi:selenium-binding protein 1